MKSPIRAPVKRKCESKRHWRASTRGNAEFRWKTGQKYSRSITCSRKTRKKYHNFMQTPFFNQKNFGIQNFLFSLSLLEICQLRLNRKRNLENIFLKYRHKKELSINFQRSLVMYRIQRFSFQLKIERTKIYYLCAFCEPVFFCCLKD